MSPHNLLHKTIPLLQAVKSLDAKASVDKEEDQLEHLQAWQVDGFEERARTEKGKDSSCCYAGGFVAPQELGVGVEVPKTHGRVVFRVDCCERRLWVSYAVYTEQGSSASQVTAAKVLVVAKLFGCAGHACDAVSACIQVKNEDVPILLKLPNSECPDIWIR